MARRGFRWLGLVLVVACGGDDGSGSGTTGGATTSADPSSASGEQTSGGPATGGPATADSTTADTGATSLPPADSTGSDTTPACGEGLSAVQIPEADAWQDHGEIFAQGQRGDWDRYLWGGFGGSVVRKDGTFYLYYQGADGYDDVEDTVTYRAVGVATSPDGLTFTKHPGNPVLTWFPGDQLEEGAASVGAWLTEQGEVRLYYGANTFVGASAVNADGRWASATDGVTVQDMGVAIDHTDPGVWGGGDELFPVLALEHAGTSLVYYIPNGTPQARTLGVAWGPAPDALTESDGVTVVGQPVVAWGMASQARLSEDTYAMFISDVQQPAIGVYTMSPGMEPGMGAPAVFEPAGPGYAFPNMSQGVVHLDRDSATWFLFYRTEDAAAYGVRTADLVCR